MKLSQLNPTDNTYKIIAEHIKFLLLSQNILSEKTGTNPEDKHFQDKKFIKWLDDNGITISSSIPPSASGSQGIVYFVGDKVIKISSDETEAKIAKIMKGDPVVAAVDVTKTGDKYAILQHAVKFDNKNPIIRALDCLMAYFDNHGKEVILTDKNLASSVAEEFAGECEEDALKIAIAMIKRVYDKTGYIHDDAAPSNVGIHNGRAVFTDLGPNRIA